MKTHVLLFGTLLLAVVSSAQDPRSSSIPPGVVQAGQAEAKANRDLPPPIPAKHRIDLAKLQQEADELSKLAQSIPDNVADIRKGMLPKDLSDKLKQIEKLSKQLRGQINP
jgi:hypothetical protein